ncbi:unnamed protein product, partial [Ixodes hexagonus]
LNPNHSYYPPAYKPPQGGYNPTNWNRYPPQQYRPGTAQSPSWYHRPTYRPPTSTYDWWKGFQRSPSFEPSGSSSNYWPASVVPPATGYRSDPPYYGTNGWQPYYIAVGYYRKSPTYPGYGSSYPSAGVGTGGYPASYGRGYPYYGSGYPYSGGYRYGGYPYTNTYSQGYASGSGAYYGGQCTYNYPYSGGYSTGKYTGSGSYPYGGQGASSFPNYYNNRYYSPWYCCTYYPGYNKGYSTSGSNRVKQNVGLSGSVQKTGSQQAPKRSYVRRALRDQLRHQQEAEARVEGSSSETLSGIQRYVEEHKPSMFKAASELSDKRLPPISMMTYDTVLDKTDSGDENRIAGDSDQGITGEMVENYQRRLMALNRMFDTLISTNTKPEESYFQKRVRSYNKLLSMAKQHRGLQVEADGKQRELQIKLEQLMTMLRGHVFRHDAIGEQTRRTVQAVYNAFHEPDLTTEDMLKVLSIAENLIVEMSRTDSEKEERGGNASGDSSSSSSSSEESKEPTTAIESKQIYDRLEKLGGLYRYVMPGLLTLEKHNDDSSDGGSKEASEAKDSADLQLKGS